MLIAKLQLGNRRAEKAMKFRRDGKLSITDQFIPVKLEMLDSLRGRIVS